MSECGFSRWPSLASFEYFERRSEPSTSNVRGPPGSTGSISSSGRSAIVVCGRSPQSLLHGAIGGAIIR